MTQSDINSLFDQTLAGAHDDDLPWDAVHALRNIGTRGVFEKAAEWCRSADPLRRARGANILAQIGQTMKTHRNAFPEDSYKIIRQLLVDEADLLPMCSAIFALGHVGNPLAVPLIVSFAAHADCEVRYAVASALCSFPHDPESVETLLALSQDSDDDVRDWATFGFGVLGDLDTPVIRDALFMRIRDPFEPARLEAFMGLAKRKDARIAPLLLEMLGQQEVNSGYIDAADELLGVVGGDSDAWKTAEYIEKLRNFSASAN